MSQDHTVQPGDSVQRFRVDVSEIAVLIKISDEIGADISEGRRLLLIAINMGKTSKNFDIIARYLGESRMMMETAIEEVLTGKLKNLQHVIEHRRKELKPDLDAEKLYQETLETFRQKKYAETIRSLKTIVERLEELERTQPVKPMSSETLGSAPTSKETRKAQEVADKEVVQARVLLEIAKQKANAQQSGKPPSSEMPFQRIKTAFFDPWENKQPTVQDNKAESGQPPNLSPPKSDKSQLNAEAIPPSSTPSVTDVQPRSDTNTQDSVKPETQSQGMQQTTSAPATSATPSQVFAGQNYVIEKATEVVKCHLCLGKVKPGFPLLRCKCGQVYHEMCAKRAEECTACGISLA